MILNNSDNRVEVNLRRYFLSVPALIALNKLNKEGKEQEISYYCIDLLWGQKLYQELRFVLVKCNGINSILVSTNCTLNPEKKRLVHIAN